MQHIKSGAILIDGNDSAAHPLRRWRRTWFSLAAVAAALATALDLVLLQKKHSLFTDGFLSEHTLSGAPSVAAFVLLSWLADAATLGPVIGLLLLCFDRLQRRGMVLVVLGLALSPIVLANVVRYRLAAYLGDAFDLGLMLDLVGGRPSELFAVGFSQILPVLLVVFGGIGLLAWMVWPTKKSAFGRRADGGFGRVRKKIGIDLFLVFMAGLALVTFARLRSEAFDHGLKRKPSGRLLEYVAQTVSDVDGDGYGLLSRPADPAPFNGGIFPYAIDWPGNGIDEDGVAGDLPNSFPIEVADFGGNPAAAASWQRRPNLVLIMLESFRQDLIGEREAGKAVTPVLNALAAQGVSAQAAYSHNGYTVQSRYHVFTGNLLAPGDGTSLIDDFKKNGYEVAFFSGQDESFGEDRLPIGVDRADVFYDAREEPERRYTRFSTPGSLGLPYTVLLERLTAFLQERKPDRPLFLYLNLYDTHFPYRHEGIEPLLNGVVLKQSEIHGKRKDALRAMYLNTAANVDRAIGQVLARLQQVLGEAPAVIVLADHGESLFEDGFLGHGYRINAAQTRIPFIVSGLPLHIEEPFAQVSFRATLNAALSLGQETENMPKLQSDPEKKVFQYIGTLERPRQIAMTGLNERVIYDFRSGRVQVGTSTWRRPEVLDPSERRAFEYLVYFWESHRLAQANGAEPS